MWAGSGTDGGLTSSRRRRRIASLFNISFYKIWLILQPAKEIIIVKIGKVQAIPGPHQNLAFDPFVADPKE